MRKGGTRVVQELGRRGLSVSELRTVLSLATDLSNIRNLVGNCFERKRTIGLIHFNPETRDLEQLAGLVYVVWTDEFLFADPEGSARFIKFENVVKGYQFPNET